MPELFEADQDLAIANGPDAFTAEKRLNHLQSLEAESIHILREATAEFSHPVMLYSIGKDSSVMLRLAQKAFFPGKIPFPLLHIDTSYKFPEMITFRDSYAREIGAELIVHRNEEAIGNGANPFSLGTQKCCGLLKTKSLLDGLAQGDSTRHLAARGAMRRNRGRKSGFILSAMRADSGIRRTSDLNSGTYSIRASTRTRASEFFRCRIGRNWMFGCTSTWKRFPLCLCISRENAKWCCGTAR